MKQRPNNRRPVLLALLAGMALGLSVFGWRGEGADRAGPRRRPDAFSGLLQWPATLSNGTVSASAPADWPTPAPAGALASIPGGAAPVSTGSLGMAAGAAAAAGQPPSAFEPRAVIHPNPGPEDLANIRQLTFDGCCPGAWWAADGAAIQFVDRPEGQLGVYAVPLWPPGSLPQIVDTRLALREGGSRFLVQPAAGQSLVKDLESGHEWPLPTGGNPVRLAGDGSRAVWWEAPGGRAQVDGLSRIYGSTIDGSDARPIAGLWDADVVAFLPDHVNVLATGRAERDNATYLLVTIDSRSGAMRELARGRWLSDVLLAPGGAWAAYMVSLDRDNPEANGVWVVPTEPGTAAPLKLPASGAYRWRDEHRLVYVPMEPGAPFHSLWQLDLRTGEATQLFDPAALPIRIASNDWSIAPDGQTLAFMSQDDRNIWAVALP